MAISIMRLLRGTPVVPVVRLTGPIGISTPFSSSITLANTAKLLDRAFAMKHAKAIALVINSPGGSAVQSHLIYQRIRMLKKENDKKVIAFVEDVAASGGYMIACAADEIIVDPSSIVGSIGVISASFGFEKAIKKLGVERRVHTAGSHKMSLDPFQREKPDDVRRLKAIQQDIHELFIGLVKKSRGRKLKGREKTLFSGEFWGGGKAVQYGLADRLGEIKSVLRERYGKKVETPLIAPPTGWLSKKTPGIGLDADLASGLISAMEARALWSRYGL
ncbi:MAG TPA: S49 family peptidase [Xanthobacteraceae bacterium]|jgi:signal peptide peptidase SppA|nr:S49 family peptidase [Xanthobacteraceae bacterium]